MNTPPGGRPQAGPAQPSPNRPMFPHYKGYITGFADIQLPYKGYLVTAHANIAAERTRQYAVSAVGRFATYPS